jgi:hypothetical protein
MANYSNSVIFGEKLTFLTLHFYPQKHPNNLTTPYAPLPFQYKTEFLGQELWSNVKGRGLTTEWLWVQTPTPDTGWCKRLLAITIEKYEIKVAKWGTLKTP